MQAQDTAVVVPATIAKGRTLERTQTPGIYRRGGRYVVIVRGPDGKQRKRAARTAAEARAIKASLTTDVARGEFRETSRTTFADYAPRWIESYPGRTAHGITAQTRESYRTYLEPASAYFGRLRLAAIEPQHVREFAQHVASRGVGRNSVRLTLAPLKCLLADAHEQGLIRSNPAAGLRIALPETHAVATDDDEGEVKRLSDAELAAFLAQVPTIHRLFFQFLSEAGLRIGEAIELRFRDLDAETRTLHIRRRIYRGQIGKPKGRKTRRVRLSAAMTSALVSARETRGAADDALIFTAERGGRICASNLMSRVLKPAARAAGIGDWPGFHTFRHTAASRLFVAGWNAVQVQKFLGHSDPGFTLRCYVHLLPEDLPEVPFGLAEVAPLRAVA